MQGKEFFLKKNPMSSSSKIAYPVRLPSTVLAGCSASHLPNWRSRCISQIQAAVPDHVNQCHRLTGARPSSSLSMRGTRKCATGRQYVAYLAGS